MTAYERRFGAFVALVSRVDFSLILYYVGESPDPGDYDDYELYQLEQTGGVGDWEWAWKHSPASAPENYEDEVEKLWSASEFVAWAEHWERELGPVLAALEAAD